MRPLLVVPRRDVTIIVPAPQYDRRTYRAGQVLGRAVGHLAGQLVVETPFGRVLVEPAHVNAERVELARRAS